MTVACGCEMTSQINWSAFMPPCIVSAMLIKEGNRVLLSAFARASGVAYGKFCTDAYDSRSRCSSFGQRGWDMCAIKSDFAWGLRSEEHTTVLQSLMRISYAVFCLK